MNEGPDADALMSMAAERTGLSDFGPDIRRAPLDAFVSSLQRECWAGMTPAAQSLAVDYIVHLLCNRLTLMADRQRHPQIPQQAIRRPMIVVGAPRSGSTLVHKLLSLDPDHLSPEHALCMEPSPPPALGVLSPARLKQAEERLMAIYQTVPDIFVTHPYLIE